MDIGGTFTDCVVFDGAEIRTLKVFSTPANAARAILEGVRKLTSESPARPTLEIIHGTAVGTNSLLSNAAARAWRW